MATKIAIRENTNLEILPKHRVFHVLNPIDPTDVTSNTRYFLRITQNSLHLQSDRENTGNLKVEFELGTLCTVERI